MWAYAGASAPKSIIIPHIPEVGLANGSFSTPQISIGPKTPESGSPCISHFGEDQEPRKLLSKRIAEQLKNSGVDFVRGWFQWNLFQKEILKTGEQEYMFPLDDFVLAMNEHGIKVVAVIGNGYYRFLPNRLNINDPIEYVSRLAEASRKIVRHYSGKIHLWQLENEPNWWMEHFWIGWRRGLIWFKKNIGETILSQLSTIVKEEDGKAQTMVNLESDTAKVFYDSYSKYCDLLGLDYYPNYIKSNPVDASGIRRIARDARKSTGNKVLISETGYSSGPWFFGFNQEKQAGYVASATKEASCSDDILGLGIWRLSDTYWRSFPFQENSFGLLARSGSPKQAWFEYVSQIRQFS